jgi:hypothetical protein
MAAAKVECLLQKTRRLGVLIFSFNKSGLWQPGFCLCVLVFYESNVLLKALAVVPCPKDTPVFVLCFLSFRSLSV